MKRFPIGTIRTHGGKKVKKTVDGWKYVVEKILDEDNNQVPSVVMDLTEYVEQRWNREIGRLDKESADKLMHAIHYCAEKGVTVRKTLNQEANVIQAHYSPIDQQIVLEDKFDDFRVFVHELGHALHHTSNVIHGRYKDFDPEVKEAVRKGYADFQYRVNSKSKSALKGLASSPPEEVYRHWRDAKVAIMGPNASNKISSEFGAICDTFAALTKGNYGVGHAKEYWSRPGAKYAEIFTHCFTARILKWEVFKSVFPNMYNDITKYFDDE